MKLVIDTNRIIAAMIRDGASRKILFSETLDFVSPDTAITELYEYEEEISRKACIDHKRFAFIISSFLEKIEIKPKSEYEHFLEESKSLIKDPDDVPFIALALALKLDGIWSDDKHFLEQSKIKVFRTIDMLKLIQ